MLLPQYMFTGETGEWQHQENMAFLEKKCLKSITYEDGEFCFEDHGCEKGAFVLDEAILKAKEIVQ